MCAVTEEPQIVTRVISPSCLDCIMPFNATCTWSNRIEPLRWVTESCPGMLSRDLRVWMPPGDCSTRSCICRLKDSFLNTFVGTAWCCNLWPVWRTIWPITPSALGRSDPLFPSSPAEAARFPVLPAMFSSMPCSCLSRPEQMHKLPTLSL